MKKQANKLSLLTSKIVSLTKTQLEGAFGGSNSGQSYNCGQSYHCIAASGKARGC